MNFINLPIPFSNPTAASTGQTLPRLNPLYLLLNSSFSTNNQAPGARGMGGVLGKMILNTSNNTNNFYNNFISFKSRIGASESINSFTLTLLDDIGNPPLFFGSNWSATIQFDLVRK